VTGDDLLGAIQHKLERVPYPETWSELAMAQFLYDRAGEFHLREYKTCSFSPYARIVTKILEEEEGHEGFGENVVLELSKDPQNRASLQELFEKWLAVALLSFGRPGTAGNRFAIATGLKTRDSGAVMQDFINDIKPTMVTCGLRFPEREKIVIEMPGDIDLHLPA
jgi:ring-1,2-phenylacetyl-CoA epoxidase subunit PaaA